MCSGSDDDEESPPPQEASSVSTSDEELFYSDGFADDLMGDAADRQRCVFQTT